MPSRWAERLWEQIDRRGDDECWPWLGHVDVQGYGRSFKERRPRRAHRLAYELLVGPIPEGMVLDHECHNRDPECHGGPSCTHRRCCNPGHMIPRTVAENILASQRASSVVNRAKTHCQRGHPFDATNTYVDRHGWRYCRACQALRHSTQAYRARERDRVRRRRERG